ncbi:LINE-1 type transposase domain-containing protein 1 [Cricetulus griseus]|uniref:LINE-1 type transposase domain-containing protein 1 n=1 Tax=Cricetulus griseus TaxID=10029 RepID=A0A061IL77_CRIGR|nr:LINE-1 type transposase domain-containing protein 1 [Cricetulus griseus]
MRRGQGKSTSNNRKPNMTPLETRNHTTARIEPDYADEPEENDLKNIFKKIIEGLKEDMRKSLKEMEEKNKPKIQDINKSLKERVQDLKTEIETIKKAQSEGILEIEKLGKRSGTKDVSITNRTQEMEERILEVEDTLAEIHSSTKENLKSNKSLSQNIQEIWDTVKRPNLRIIGIEEGEEIQLRGTENTFNKIMEENFPNLKKDMPMKIQEAYRTPSRLNQKKVSLSHNNQNTKHTQQRDILRVAKKKGQVTYKGKPIRITPDFSMETLKARRS